MSLTIRTNLAALAAQRALTENQSNLDSSLAKLSSGFRITRAQDDAAGLGVGANLNAQLRSFAQASRNANDGLSVVQTAEAALNEVTNILTRLRELAMESASDGVGNTERGFIETENQQLQSELARINNTAEFNGTFLFGAGAVLSFQVGIRNTADDALAVDTTGMDLQAAALFAVPVDLTTSGGATAALSELDTAISAISGFRSDLGASAVRLLSASNTIAQTIESLSAAASRIRDTDIAAETANLSRAQILVQAGVSVLAQANQAPQVALKLLS